MDHLSKYLEDISFISWVFEPSTSLDLIWNNYQAAHAEERRNIQIARKIILQFRVTAKTFSEEEKILLFARVLKQIEEKEKSRKSIRLFIGLTKYAAVALIFFSIGSLLFYRQETINPGFYTLASEEHIPDNRAQLIRPNGENVLLNDQRSVLSYQKTGELVVNKDTLQHIIPDSKTLQSLNQLIIPFGKTSEILLSDGTKVILNAGSRLAYPDLFTGDSREVFLMGEAYFEVKHDSKHPFFVHVNDLCIKDLGTRFNVSAYTSDGSIETVLAEGKVSIRQNNSSLFTPDTELIPGQMASFSRQNSKFSIKTVDTNDYILWTQGLMKFETVDLSRIIKKLERYYNIRFEYANPLLGTVQISGKLEMKNDRKEVLERIARTASVKIVEKGENYYEIIK